MSVSDLCHKGYCVLKDFISKDLANNFGEHISRSILNYSDELNISLSRYLRCTGRWANSPGLYGGFSEEVDALFERFFQSTYGLIPVRKKRNITYKGHAKSSKVPFHQDISYSPDDPYHYTLWISLSDCKEFDGALALIDGSHNWKIENAVDFWSPNFEDIKQQLFDFNLPIVELGCGDAIMFDSRLWHGSYPNSSGQDRFAYVSRWSITDLNIPKIPKIIPNEFGMWNCQNKVRSIIDSILQAEDSSSMSFEDLLNEFIKLFRNNGKYYPFRELGDALEDLLVLDRASKLHDAGDLTGEIYKKVWLLLNKYI